jgi:hypothetical protein
MKQNRLSFDSGGNYFTRVKDKTINKEPIAIAILLGAILLACVFIANRLMNISQYY